MRASARRGGMSERIRRGSVGVVWSRASATAAPRGITSQIGACIPLGNIAWMAGKVSIRCGEASRPNM